MSDRYFWCSEAQPARIQPLSPDKARGAPRVDDRRAIPGVIHVIRPGLMWRYAPACSTPVEHGVFRSVGELRDAIHRFIDEHDATEAKPFARTAQPEEIIAARKKERVQTLEAIRQWFESFASNHWFYVDRSTYRDI